MAGLFLLLTVIMESQSSMKEHGHGTNERNQVKSSQVKWTKDK